jgi:hypothetical protein
MQGTWCGIRRRSGAQQRVRELIADPDKHFMLVTLNGVQENP